MEPKTSTVALVILLGQDYEGQGKLGKIQGLEQGNGLWKGFMHSGFSEIFFITSTFLCVAAASEVSQSLVYLQVTLPISC